VCTVERRSSLRRMSSRRSSMSLDVASAEADIELPACETEAASSSVPAHVPTHFFLYLNKHTFDGQAGTALANEVGDWRAAGLQVVMAHENDDERGGCPFQAIIEMTPRRLVVGGLYDKLAIAFVGGESHRVVSHKQLAGLLGAVRPSDTASLRRSPSDSEARSSASKRSVARSSSSRRSEARSPGSKRLAMRRIGRV